ncbi:response regulator receiver sensor signal transduction histidine kinase [Crinalium epipsammum PCC 9333]|uniref:histidine kinase n=1 Tax=Crinalium epipsammum PCC 9333 TaxID=1173022 RepID=K9W349_9CYAN|nr:ATP-binding protein [Crinalium epipsammum]AFZ14621.1 response regulator receiver sensor signal transduction histidine kinase [Crinalium epipsammum PCC 9333]
MNDIKILIVEDELLIARSLDRKLQDLGYTVVDIVSSGEAAIQSVEQLQPDLILMDIVIKGELDGIETAAIIHEKSTTPVIFVTAYADDDTLERAEKTGSYGYILKPFKEREINATIKIALAKHQEHLKTSKSLSILEAVNQDKSRILASVSHDLRNPLTTILTSTHLLKDYGQKFSQEKKDKHYERISGSVKKMNQLIEEVLVWSKTDLGKLSFKPSRLDAIAFCKNLIEEFKIIATPEHTLTLSTTEENIELISDEKLLLHILGNLLSNAIKYSPQGGTISLEISCDRQQVIFRIQDQGIGIPTDYQAQMFQPFERAINVGSISGTGLGLWIVKHSVDLHGGQISVDSVVGVGTTFTVTLPSGI